MCVCVCVTLFFNYVRISLCMNKERRIRSDVCILKY